MPFEQYVTIHETVMARFRDQGFVTANSLEFENLGTRFFLAGQIACQGRIVIDVLKELEWLDRGADAPCVQTIMYSYNVGVRGVGSAFRYDNQHAGYVHAGHADAHHKHVFAWPSIRQTLEWIGAERWPTLGAVIEEARQWHADNYSRLPDPTGSVPESELHRGLRF